MINFSKYAGCGNDFILIDNRLPNFPTPPYETVKKLCHRHLGIGADGIVLLENSSVADFKMRIFNADGSEAEMCGNGIRCLFKFIHQIGYPGSAYKIETKLKILNVKNNFHDVVVEMGNPERIKWDIPLMINGQQLTFHYLDTGVPHAVLFTDDVETIDLKVLGPLVRHHAFFSPKGTNVNIAEKMSGQELKIRTFERGVEDETLACGTGVTATALAAAEKWNLASPITVHTQSKEKLKISFEKIDDQLINIELSGPATFVFEGKIALTQL